MKTKTIAAAIVVAAVAIAVIAGAYWYSLPHYPWLFKGAYATYAGNSTILFIPVQFNARLEVVDYNATHAEIFMLVKITALGTSAENSTMAWVSIQEKNYPWPGMTYNRTYEGDYYVEGYGVRHCFVAENIDGGEKGLLYIDSQTLWPLKLELVAAGFTQQLNLTETNITLK